MSIQHTVDNGYVNELYTQTYSRLKIVLISYPQIKPLKIKSLYLYHDNNVQSPNLRRGIIRKNKKTFFLIFTD